MPQALSSPAQRSLIDRYTQSDLVTFVRRAFETVVPGESLHLNWHIHAMAHQLERVRQGNCKRLLVTIPPRSLKSIVTSVSFPAFVLGHDPTTKIVCASYSHELAVKHAIDFRAVMKVRMVQAGIPTHSDQPREEH